jgi:hypothetical protein
MKILTPGTDEFIMEVLRLIARVLFNVVKSCYNFIDPLSFAHPCNSLSNWKLDGSFALSWVAASEG